MTPAFSISALASVLAYSAVGLAVWRQPRRWWAFMGVLSLSWCWALSLLLVAQGTLPLTRSLWLEVLRDGACLCLLAHCNQPQSSAPYWRVGAVMLSLLWLEWLPDSVQWLHQYHVADPRLSALLILAMMGLMAVEQLWRSTPLPQRWPIKPLALALALLFTVDFIVYSQSLLWNRVALDWWPLRNAVHAAMAPLWLLSHQRWLQRQTPMQPRRITPHYSVGLLGGGAYLVLLALSSQWPALVADYRDLGQWLFAALAVLLMLGVWHAGALRAWGKRYLQQHGLCARYPYRQQWRNISQALAHVESLAALTPLSLTILSDLVGARGGGLWLQTAPDHWQLVAQQQLQLSATAQAFCQHPQGLSAYLQRKRWVVDWLERASTPEVDADSALNALEADDSAPWLVVPLWHQQRLEAFVVLTHPQPPRALNSEDHDLLKTVGMQLANALALQQASEALACHRQFETYHRLSAYLVHDLKNLGAQLGLIVSNADKHRHNPAFVDDALHTLHHAADKIEQLVAQLKQGDSAPQPPSLLNLAELVEQVLHQVPAQPALHWQPPPSACPVHADRQQLSRALRNLIENAQQACLPDGQVQLALAQQHDCAVLTIRDDGCGMTPDFVAQRLFKPFDTTKGNAGMGIGAYEARETIVQQRGCLSVDSQAGCGTTLTVQLPLAGCAAV